MSPRFANNVIRKYKCHCSKCPVDINKKNFEKMVVSDEFSCNEKGFKQFIGLRFGKKIMLLYCKTSKMVGYVKHFV